MNKNDEQILLDSILLFERDIIPKLENKLQNMSDNDKPIIFNLTEKNLFDFEVLNLFIKNQRLYINEMLRNTFSSFDIFSKINIEIYNIRDSNLSKYTERLSIKSFFSVSSLSIDFYRYVYEEFKDIGFNFVTLKSQGFSLSVFNEEDFNLIENNLFIVLSKAYRKAILDTIRRKSALSAEISYIKNDGSFVKFIFNDLYNKNNYKIVSEGSLSTYFSDLKEGDINTVTKSLYIYNIIEYIEKKVFLKHKESNLFFSNKKDNSIFYVEKDTNTETIVDFGYFSSDELKEIIFKSRKYRLNKLGLSKARDFEYEYFFDRMKFL